MRPVMTAAELAEHKVTAHGRDHVRSGDGYDDMELAGKQGWHAVPGWGRDGWDLGNWPYVVIYTREVREQGIIPFVKQPGGYEMQQIVEGDHTVYGFDTEEDRNAAIDYMFLWYAADESWAPLSYADRHLLDEGVLPVDDRFRGPFSWSRLEAEKP